MTTAFLRSVFLARGARATRRAALLAAFASLAVAPLASMAQDSSARLRDRLPASVKSAGVLRMVGDSFAPYRIVAPDGKVTGIETDLARALEPLLGVKIEQTIVSNLPALLAGIDTGRYDLSSGPLLSTREREMRYDIVTWLLSKPAFVLPATGKRPARLEDLCGMRISFAAGSISETYVDKVSDRCRSAGLPAAQPVGLQDQNAAILAMQSGRADAVTSQLASGLYLQRQNPGKFLLQTDQTDALGVLNLGFVSKKDSGLAPVLLEALQRVWASGEYDRILERYGLEGAKAPEPMLNPSSK